MLPKRGIPDSVRKHRHFFLLESEKKKRDLTSLFFYHENILPLEDYQSWQYLLGTVVPLDRTVKEDLKS